MDTAASSGTTYIHPNQMQPAIELNHVNPLPGASRDTVGSGWPAVSRQGHVRSASHGGVSLLNPTFQRQQIPSPPSQTAVAVGFLEVAGRIKTERASHDSLGSTQPKAPPSGTNFCFSVIWSEFSVKLNRQCNGMTVPPKNS